MAFIGDYHVGMYKSLNDKITWFMEHYAPSNLFISGTTTLGANTTIGASDSDVLTVNAQATFNNGIAADEIIVDALTVRNNTVIGQDNYDTLTVNSRSNFEGPVTFNNLVTVNENIILGTDYRNTVTANGIVSAPHFTIPRASDNSFRFGSSDLITYHEYSADANIYTSYPDSVIVQIKNVNITGFSISITYNSDGSTVVLSYLESAVF